MCLSSRHRSLVFALALALWLATTLGLVHRTLHSPGAAPAVVASFGAGAVTEDQAISPHGLAALFGHHSDAECRLYDQLSHGPSAPGVPLVVLPMLLPAATFAFLEGEALARWVVLLRARGPPVSR